MFHEKLCYIIYVYILIIAVVAKKNSNVESVDKTREKTADEILHHSKMNEHIRNIEKNTSYYKEDFVVKVNVAAELKALKNRTRISKEIKNKIVKEAREFKNTRKVKEIQEVRKQPKHETKSEDQKNSKISNAILQNVEENLLITSQVTSTKSVDSKEIHRKVPRIFRRRKTSESKRVEEQEKPNKSLSALAASSVAIGGIGIPHTKLVQLQQNHQGETTKDLSKAKKSKL